MKEFLQNQTVFTQELRDEIDMVIDSHNCQESKLVEILLDVQQKVKYQYISKETAYYVSERMGINISQVYDVISFFEALYEEPRAKYPIQMCMSIVCKVNQNDVVYETLKELLGIDLNEVTYDGKFTLEQVACFGACDQAPAVRINGKVYGKLTDRSKIETMLEGLQ